MRYKLSLTTEDGELLQSWALNTSPDADPESEYTIPLSPVADGWMLVEEINREVIQAEANRNLPCEDRAWRKGDDDPDF